MYASQGPGTYAGDKRKILGPEESRAICEEANSRGTSIEMVFKSREDVEGVVINMIVPFPQEAPQTEETKPEEGKEATAEAPAPSE